MGAAPRPVQDTPLKLQSCLYEPGRQRKHNPEFDTIAENKSVRLYLAALNKNGKQISKEVKWDTYIAVRKFLQQTKRPITTTIMDELVQRKKDNPKDTSIEEELTLWKAETTSSTIPNRIARILGIFHRNYARLQMTVHVEGSGAKTIPIKEPILRAIRIDEELQEKHRLAIDLMAFGAERVKALAKLPTKNVRLMEGTQSAILDIPARLSKTATPHPSIIPKELAEKLLQKAQEEGSETLFQNHERIWKEIKDLAKRKYKVRLTSHYLRKRFETIAETIPSTDMNPNHWMLTMGSTPSLGHLPEHYSLHDEEKLIREYEQFLLPRLALTGQEIKAPTNKLDELAKENRELKEQIIELSRLLTKALTKTG